MIVQYFVYFICLQGFFSLSITNRTSSSSSSTSVLTQNDKKPDKKGIIRIAGPWHSESALDRNVDIGEDSYVKKIISSNEGINFNKDMAEAGEMFEVNGIDDFYDKNAMITYEINGHEIPVHMKPHFTPQTKSMFPEYVKDSPGEMAGFVRGKGSRVGGKMHGYIKQINSVRFPGGLSINDMPEYKMQRFTGKTSENSNMWKSLEGMKEDKVNGVITNGFKQNKALQKMFQKQLPVISELKKMQQQRSNSYDHHVRKSVKYEGTDQSLKYHVPRHQEFSKPVLVNNEFIHNQREQAVRNSKSLGRNPKLLQQFMASRNAQDKTLPMSKSSEYSKESPMVNRFVSNERSSFLNSQNTPSEIKQSNEKGDVHFKADIAPRPLDVMNRYEEQQPAIGSENNQATALFKNLDSLHKKLQIDKQINQVEQQSKLDQDPQKAQAKTRILNLLGELTEKLKGMESIVTKHQNKEIAEKFMKDQPSPEIEGRSKEEVSTFNNSDESQGVREVPLNSEPEVEAMNRLGAQLTEKVSSLQHGLDEGLQNADSRSYKEDSPNEAIATAVARARGGTTSKVHNNFLAESFMKIGESPSEEVNQGIQSDSEEAEHHRVENKEIAMENPNSKEAIIQSFHYQRHSKDDDEPVIMDTKAIDYKPLDENDDVTDDSGKINNINSYGEDEIVQDSPKHRKKFVGKDDEDDDEDDDNAETNSEVTLKKHWKKPEVDEDPIPSRQTLVKYHHNNMKDSEDSERTSSLTGDEAANGIIEKKKAASRRHSQHRVGNHHHRHTQQFQSNKGFNEHVEETEDEERDEDEGKGSTTDLAQSSHHHKRHHPKHMESSSSAINEEGQEVEETSTQHHKKNHAFAKSLEDKQGDDGNFLEEDSKTDGRENSKMFEVEESLGEADEKNNIARHRSFKPKSLEEDEAVEYPDYNEVKDAAIFETNLLRKKFHARSLRWSDRLSDKAQKSAETISKVTDLNDKVAAAYKEPGENVALLSIDSTNVGKEAPDQWAGESPFFDFRSPQLTPKNSDFAQMMWKAESEFGLGVAKSKLGNKWVVTSVFDNPTSDRYNDLKHNVESDIPISDPYSDITG